jgi:diguanylate cyclase (GGDEF)-like protein
MKQAPVPVIVLSARQDDVEIVNQSLREAGHPVRCAWQADFDDFGAALGAHKPHLIVFFVDTLPVSTADVAKARHQHGSTAPLVVVAKTLDEDAICAALKDGAQDLVSIGQRERLRAVAAREMRTFRLQQAVGRTLAAANEYKAQVKSLMAGSIDAMAQVQEGIVVDANPAWAALLKLEPVQAAHGPLMDFIDKGSHAALKGALLACARNKWDGRKLKIGIVRRAAGTQVVEVQLAMSRFDGEPSIRLVVQRTIERPAVAPVAPVTPVTPAPGPAKAAGLDRATGLLDRQRFVENLTSKLGQRRQSGARALALIRIDRFRELAKAVGPVASEEIVVHSAKLLQGLTAEQDVCGRFGGTVFGVIVQRGTLKDIEAWAESVINRFSETLIEAGGKSMTATCTIGIAEMGSDTSGVEGLVINAERATRAGRADGGNRVVLEETSDENTRIKRIDSLWMYQIKSALVENRFRLVHLGIASLGGGTQRMLDTILRLVDQQGDEVAATEFMESARRNKLARAIDRWVIGASVGYCAAHECDAFFLKLSGDSLVDPHLVDWIAKQCGQKSVDPHRLVIQVAEAEAMHFQKQVRSLSEQLHAAKIRFALEHFGLGRDPLRLLQQLPLDFIKIDGSLMQSVGANPELQERVTAYVTAAKERRIETIAERVDDANTMAVLFQLGIGYMQGHYVHEPEVVLEASA